MKIVFKGSDTAIKKGETLTLEKIDFNYCHITLRARKDDGLSQFFYYHSLEELSNDWEIVEDHEEPKGFWMINILGIVEYTHDMSDAEVALMKSIGNYFETEDKAEKAREKIGALTRLEDKGFRFYGYEVEYNEAGDTCGKVLYDVGKCSIEDIEKDLDLLFLAEK